VAVDEYSILANAASAKRLLALIVEKGIEEIYVAGLCGDYCVGNTIKDLVAAGHADKIRVLTRYIGNIDDGTTLRSIIAEHNLQVVE
jgi:nicotinamidase-related amidase